MKTYTTLLEIYKDAGTHQVTAQELINGRSRLNDDWTAFDMTPELKESICKKLSEIYGGRQATKDLIYYRLMNGRPQNWGLGRTVIEHYKGWEDATLSYIAGQSEPDEIKEIRNDLKK